MKVIDSSWTLGLWVLACCSLPPAFAATASAGKTAYFLSEVAFSKVIETEFMQ